MKKTSIWKGLAAIGLAAVLILASVAVLRPSDRTILAAGDTYQVSSEEELTAALEKYEDNDTIQMNRSVL